MRYSAVWQRALAIAIDTLPFAATYLLIRSLPGLHPVAAIVKVVVLGLLAELYFVAFHARLGQTPGKMLARIKVVSWKGAPIGLREAAVRQAISLLITAVSIPFSVSALMRVDPETYSRSTSLERQIMVEREDRMPPNLRELLSHWLLFQGLVMLANRERRTIHDFLAGTVVLDLRRPRKPAVPRPPVLNGFTASSPDASNLQPDYPPRAMRP